jgi:hypothetical protein
LDTTLKTAVNGTIVPSRATDYPTILSYGPSFFESYTTFSNTKYIHGFNLALSTTSTSSRRRLLAGASLACAALAAGKLLYWEMGNEPDLYTTSAQGVVRPRGWNEGAYVEEWLNATRAVRAQMDVSCPDMAAAAAEHRFVAPSFAGVGNGLDLVKVWEAGLGRDGSVAEISGHKYVGFWIVISFYSRSPDP